MESWIRTRMGGTPAINDELGIGLVGWSVVQSVPSQMKE